jgi:hypothetical protein
VVAGDVERQADGRRQGGLEPAGLARAQPFDVEVVGAPEGEQAVERLGLVAVAGDRERAGRAQAGILARRLGQLGAEVAEHRRAAQVELEQRVLAELRLGDRGEHPRGDTPRGIPTGVDDDGAQAALGRAPRARQADRAAPCDGDVKRTRGHCWTLPPYAGTTRIRFDGRRPAAALSARFRGLP